MPPKKPPFSARGPSRDDDRRSNDETPRRDGDRPKFEGGRPRSLGDRPQGSRSPRHNNDRRERPAGSYADRPRHDGDRPRYDNDRSRHGARPRPTVNKPQGPRPPRREDGRREGHVGGHSDRPRYDNEPTPRFEGDRPRRASGRPQAQRSQRSQKQGHRIVSDDTLGYDLQDFRSKALRPERTQRIEAAYKAAKTPGQRPAPKTPAPAVKKKDKGETHWGEVAEWYDRLVGDEGSEYHRKVIMPGVLRLLDLNKLDIETPRVLDLACGQGVLGRWLAEEGCEVVGVDAAEPLIAAARRRNQQDKLPIKYIVADVTELVDEDGELTTALDEESFDAVTIVLAIQNIAPLSPVWQACHRVLKPGGKLVVVMMHPCFRIPKNSDWHWDEATFSQSRLVRGYLGSMDIEIQMHPGHAAHGLDTATTTHFHRPLQAYINTMGNAGLYIDHIDEWTSHKTDQAGPKKEAMDRARKEIPMFLGLRAIKVK